MRYFIIFVPIRLGVDAQFHKFLVPIRLGVDALFDMFLVPIRLGVDALFLFFCPDSAWSAAQVPHSV